MEIRTLRTNKGLTQSEAASLVGLSLRTYQNYESGASFRDTFKKNNIIRILKEYEPYSSKKGIYPYIFSSVNSISSKKSLLFTRSSILIISTSL